MELKKTSLHSKHLSLGATMGLFAGYSMPLHYVGAKAEAIAVRETMGLFDVSHMAEFLVQGAEATEFVDYLVPNNVADLKPHSALYTPLCREDGTIVDDLIVYKLTAEKILLCVNASNHNKDWQHILSFSKNYQIEIIDCSQEYCLLALQGPQAIDMIHGLRSITGCKEIPQRFRLESLGGTSNYPYFISRTGYTGEDGVEVFCSPEMGGQLWDQLISKKVQPCGLVARDVLRTEAAYPLYGQELTDETTPFDCGLKWTVKLEKDKFVGRQALLQSPPKWRSIKLSLEVGIPRPGAEVCDENGQIIGQVTSGTYSAHLKKGVALAKIEKKLFPSNEQFFIKLRGSNKKAVRHLKSFLGQR